VKCKKGTNYSEIEVLSSDQESKKDTWRTFAIQDTYINDNGELFTNSELLRLIKNNNFYLYDLLVNGQKEVIELTINQLCETGCLIEHQRFIFQGTL